MFSPSIFTSIINGYLPEPHSSLLNGIIFGVSLRSGKIFYQQLKITGLLHLVVLSGINITMLSAIIGSATSFLSKRLSVLITILTIVIFIIFVGPQAPVIRAGFMGVLTLVAIIYGRQTIALYSLLLSVIFIAIFWPKWLTSVSLYLSYGATLGLIFFAKRTNKKGLFYYCIDEIRTSLAAQIFTTPIIFLYFKQISFISPISNLLISFLIPPLMIFGFLTAFLGKIHFILGLLPSYFCYGITSYMVFIIQILSKIPFVFISF